MKDKKDINKTIASIAIVATKGVGLLLVAGATLIGLERKRRR